MRDKIIAACATGDVEALRPLLGTGDDATQLTLGRTRATRSPSCAAPRATRAGEENVAILEEVMPGRLRPSRRRHAAGHLCVAVFLRRAPRFADPAEEQVELFRLVTAGDYQE